jgi:AcrR family transcriptional regulator
MNERQALKRQRTTEKILQAAKELIQENGFNRLSLRAVASRSGFSPASLYEYFNGKDDIIDTLCEQIDAVWTAKLSSATSLQELTKGYIEFGLTASDDFQLLYQRAMLPTQEEGIPKLFLQHAEALRLQLRVEPSVLAEAMWSLGHGLVLLSLHRDVEPDTHDVMIESTLSGFLNA